MPRILKITMSVESNDGDSSTLIRTFIYTSGATEDCIAGMFWNFLQASDEFCNYSVGIRLPIYFEDIELNEEQKKLWEDKQP